MPFWKISLETANQFYAWGWWGSMCGAAITLLALFFLYWGTRVRDHDFESQIAGLHDRAASSEKQSKELEQGNLSLQKEVERERVERLKLEAAVAPRSLSQDQNKVITTALKPFAGTVVRLDSYVSDPESAFLGKTIAEILTEAGLTVVGTLGGKIPTDFARFGIHVSATNEANRPIAHGIASAIGDQTKLQTTYNPSPLQEDVSISFNVRGGPSPQVLILIGFKPLEDVK